MISKFINIKNFDKMVIGFNNEKPFPYAVIDNFLDKNFAEKIYKEFPKYNEKGWYVYKNALEEKKISNNWNFFSKSIYTYFNIINDPILCKLLSSKLRIPKLYPDPGLHGGGLHIHSKGGKLNPHFDYDLHPKINKRRKINLIVFLNKNWKIHYGGQLGFWKGNKTKPLDLIKEIDPIFNRAVIFDTSKNSWHGLSRPVNCPKTFYRKSLASYYLIDNKSNKKLRERALFYPVGDQLNKKEVLKLIKLRSSKNNFSKAYRRNDI